MLHEETSVTSRDFSGLPEALSSALAEFCRHLSAERALSRHTVRAYQGDVQSLLEYAWQCGVGDPGSLDLTTLRGWLANQHQGGAARATLARRGAAARAFTAYAHRQGWLATDPGPPPRPTHTHAPDPVLSRSHPGRARHPAASSRHSRPG